jgi:hypothetical protein
MLSVESAVKVPVSGERRLLSTGKYDYGVQAALQRHGTNHAVYFDLAAVYYGGAEFPARQDSRVIPTAIVGYEYRLTQRTHLNVQAYVSRSTYTHEQTDLDELTGVKYQYSLGVRHYTNKFLFSFGITENVQNINNTPDIGFQLGVAYVPHPGGLK